MIKPPRLLEGNVIGIIAPGSPVDEKKLNKSVSFLENKGYGVLKGRNLLRKSSYLAGSDDERLADLHSMFLDPDVKAIMLARGGYGTMRLLEDIDYEIIKKHPKILIGYSDATALQAGLLQYAGLITFSGPMAAPDFGADNINSASADHLFEMLKGHKETLDISSHSLSEIEVLKEGNAAGHVYCGCLTILSALCGSRAPE